MLSRSVVLTIYNGENTFSAFNEFHFYFVGSQTELISYILPSTFDELTGWVRWVECAVSVIWTNQSDISLTGSTNIACCSSSAVTTWRGHRVTFLPCCPTSAYLMITVSRKWLFHLIRVQSKTWLFWLRAITLWWLWAPTAGGRHIWRAA